MMYSLGVFPKTWNPAKHSIAWEAEGSNTSRHLAEWW